MRTLSERLKNLLFLELKKDKAAEIFKAEEIKNVKEDIFIPINTDFLVKNINDNDSIKNIPLTEFILGMIYSIGSDSEFKYKDIYIKLLASFEDTERIVKKKAAELFKNDKKIDSFILLKGLLEVKDDKEIMDTLLNLSEEIAIKDPDFIDNALILSETAINSGNINGHLISGSLYRIKKDEGKELYHLREYLSKGGNETPEITDELKAVERNVKIEEAYEIVLDKPKEALEILLSYYNEEKNNPRLLLNIAVCYRLLQNYQKALLYLEEAMEIDRDYLDVVNEIGLNYAMLSDFKTAATYFKPVFEATKEMAPLTNLIICYFNIGEKDEAMKYFTIAKDINPDDEILSVIEKTYLSKE